MTYEEVDPAKAIRPKLRGKYRTKKIAGMGQTKTRTNPPSKFKSMGAALHRSWMDAGGWRSVP